jgi:HAD superfamily hydrolase (TIGR01549 family)
MKDLIFDVDGVLLISTNIGITSLIEAAKQAGVTPPTFNMVKDLWGHGLEISLVPILANSLDWPLNKDREVIERFYEISYAQKYPVQSGLVDDLKRMSRSRRLGIVTNRDIGSLRYRFEEQGIDLNIFTHIHTPESGVRKPNPKVFDHFWNGAGFKPENTIFVGDSIEHDLVAARTHSPQITFAAITSGLHGIGEFIRAGVKCTNIFANVQDLLKAKYLIA